MDLSLLNNPLFVGGGALGLVGVVTVWIKSVAYTVYSFVRREIITELEVNESDDSFRYIENWLTNHEYAEKNKSLTIKTRWYDEDPTFLFLPSIGLHIFKDDGRYYWLIRSRKDVQNDSYKAFFDTFYISTFFGNKEIFNNLIKKCYESYKEKTLPIISIKYYSHGWNICNSKSTNSPNRLVMTKQQEELFKDFETFNSSKSKYEDDGVPYRRGYLFYGKPGNGKSAMIVELAKKFKKDVFFMNLTELDVSDSKLVQMLNEVHSNSIVVFEEIDTVFENREKVGDANFKNTLSFGGLLNSLDGVIARDGRVVVMTTNNIDKLDSALIRPGRIDVKLYFDDAQEEQIEVMVDRFFGKNNTEKLKEKLIDLKPSMAQLQEWCIKHRENADALLEELNNA